MDDQHMIGRVEGWYSDPQAAHSERYWDGVGWTSHVRNLDPASADQPVRQSSIGLPSASLTRDSVRPIASAQKLVIYAIVLNFCAVAVRLVPTLVTSDSFVVVAYGTYCLGLVIALASTVMSLVGVYQLASGLDYAIGWRVLFLLFMFVPLVSLLVLLILNDRATKTLRAAGLQVGLLGARS